MNKITYICFVFLFSIHIICESQVQQVRIDFESPTGYIRPLLLGFDPTNTATDGVDWGWDVLNFTDIPGDLNWMIEGDRYVVQGVGEFDETKKYPFGMFLTYSGTITISLVSLNNFNTPIDVYIYNAVLDTYTQINDDDFTADMTNGDFIDIYYIAFFDPTLSSSDNDFQETKVQYLNKTKELYINTYNNLNLKKISIHNLLGQEIYFLNCFGENEIKASLNNIRTGIYLVTITTDKGDITKKIIIQ